MFSRRQSRPTDLAEEVGIAAHDELVTGAGQPDVEAFAEAFESRFYVDDEHDGAAFEPFEAEDVSVKDLLGIPEAVLVGGAAGGLSLELFRVAAAGCYQGDVLGSPALLEQQLDLVVADAIPVCTAHT